MANFSNADLRDAVLVWAALTAAYFIGTNLENSDLTSCHVYGVSAWGVKLISEGQTSAGRTSHIERVRNTNHKIRDRELSSKSGGTSAGTDWHRAHADLTDPCRPSFPISLAIERATKWQPLLTTAQCIAKKQHTVALFTRTITTRCDLCNGLTKRKGAACDLE